MLETFENNFNLYDFRGTLSIVMYEFIHAFIIYYNDVNKRRHLQDASSLHPRV